MCGKTRGDGPEMNKLQNDSLYCQPSYILILHFYVFPFFHSIEKKNKQEFIRKNEIFIENVHASS